MHPQIANSFIRLLSPRDRRPTKSYSWLRWLMGRALTGRHGSVSRATTTASRDAC